MGSGSEDWDREWNPGIGGLGSGRSGREPGSGCPGIGTWGSWEPGSGCQGFPGTGIWELGGLGGQIIDTNLRGLGLRSGYPGSGDWDPWTGIWVSCMGFGGICMVIQSSNLRDMGIRDWDPGIRGLGSGGSGVKRSGHPGLG